MRTIDAVIAETRDESKNNRRIRARVFAEKKPKKPGSRANRVKDIDLVNEHDYSGEGEQGTRNQARRT